MRPLALLLALASVLAANDKRPLEPLDLLKLDSLGIEAISPDGRWVVYSKSLLDWKKGRRATDLFLVPAEGGEARQMTFSLEYSESSLAWARDSRSFFFLSDRNGGKRQVYRMPVDGGEAVKLTDDKDGVVDFARSRDGRWLAYRSGAAGARTLWILDLREAEPSPRKLTDGPHGVLVWAWAWDSSGVLFTAPVESEALSRERGDKGFNVRVNDEPKGPRALRFAAAEAGEAREVAPLGDWVVDEMIPSPNGRHWALQMTPNRRYATEWDREVHLLDFRAGRIRRLTQNGQQETDLGFSPDGALLAFTGPDGGEQYRATKVFVAPVAGGAARKLSPRWKYDAGADAWSADGRAILFGGVVGVNRQIFRLPLDGGDPESLTTGDQSLTLRADAESGRLLVQRTTPSEPTELFLADPAAPGDTSRWTRLTNFAAGLEPFALGEYETVRWTSTDGATVEGALVKPVGYREGQRYPLIVQVHGGPAGTSFSAFSARWGTYPQVLAGRGYLVFQPNYRGSTGYGEEFRRAIAGDYFRQGFEDIISGVDSLIERGMADPEKMGHMGWSAGGHWSNWALTQTDRFRAISSGAGAANWLSMWAQSDMQINREFYFGGKPYENREHYLAVSPVAHIQNAKTPTLILCGTADARVPNPQSRELYMNLRALGVPTEYIEFPGEGHGLTNPRYELVKMEAELAWFDKWIHGAEGWIDWKKLMETVPR